MSEDTGPKIIAAMPAYNEAKYIGTVILKTLQYVDEAIVVDDGSSDDTAEIARLAGATVIKHASNLGYGATIQHIFKEARKRVPDVLVLLDADGQHKPEEIPTMVQPIINGFDLVVGSRSKQTDYIPLYRRIGQRIILFSTRMASTSSLSDTECGFRCFSARAISELELKENGMAVSAETIMEAGQKGLRITEVPVSVSYDGNGSTMNPLAHGMSVITRIIAMISERRPLFFFGLAGVIVATLGLVAGIRTLRLYSDSGALPIGTALIAVMLVITGVFSVFTGFILHALAKRRI